MIRESLIYIKRQTVEAQRILALRSHTQRLITMETHSMRIIQRSEKK